VEVDPFERLVCGVGVERGRFGLERAGQLAAEVSGQEDLRAVRLSSS
jgi:hypothetical protein